MRPRQIPKPLFALLQRFVAFNLGRQVAGGSSIPFEVAVLAKNRLAADADVVCLVAAPGDRIPEVAERSSCLEVRLVSSPVFVLVGIDVVRFPSSFAEGLVRSPSTDVRFFARIRNKLQILVHFPHPVRGRSGKIPEALLAFLQSLLAFDFSRHISGSTPISLKVAVVVECRLTAGAEVVRLTI